MKNEDSFRLILRYGLDPENGLEENLRQLRRFAEESTIDEVMFLLAPEERFELLMDDSVLQGRQFRILNPDGSWRALNPEIVCHEGVATISLEVHLRTLESAFLTLT